MLTLATHGAIPKHRGDAGAHLLLVPVLHRNSRAGAGQPAGLARSGRGMVQQAEHAYSYRGQCSSYLVHAGAAADVLDGHKCCSTLHLRALASAAQSMCRYPSLRHHGAGRQTEAGSCSAGCPHLETADALAAAVDGGTFHSSLPCYSSTLEFHPASRVPDGHLNGIADLPLLLLGPGAQPHHRHARCSREDGHRGRQGTVFSAARHFG